MLNSSFKKTILLLYLQFFVIVCPVFSQEPVPVNATAPAQVVVAQNGAHSISGVANEKWSTVKKMWDIVIEFIVKYSFQVLGGIIVLIAGWFLARFAANFIQKFLAPYHLDVTVLKFITGAVNLLVMAFAVIVALGKFGIEIAPLIAGISVIGFATSFALQGPLSNYASGATLIFTKPFKVGDIIEVVDAIGEVADMKLPRTEIKTVDGETIVIPNKHIIGEVIHNHGTYKRVDINVGVGYQADVQKAIDAVKDVLLKDTRITREKPAKVGISEFGDSSINICVRLWCKQDQYWDVLFDTNKNILSAFKNNGIEIPFPQRDVHVYKEQG
jgi:small conductance mechanosensitive channel